MDNNSQNQSSKDDFSIKDKRDFSTKNVPSQTSTNTLSDSYSPIDFFAHDQSFVYVYKKTEKLATALYMVTNLFGDNEPMKWTLRTKISHLLSFILGFKDLYLSQEEEFRVSTETRVLEIVSLLEIASRSGLISNMNFTILKSEFMHLVDTIASVRSSSGSPAKDEEKAGGKIGERGQFVLERDMFQVTQNQAQNLPVSSTNFDQNNNLNNTRRLSSKLPLNRSNFSSNRNNNFANQGDFQTTSEAQNFIGNSSTNLRDNHRENKPFHKTDRQNTIINLLQKKSNLTIKDIATVVKNCSEKTVQRELISLIEAGMVVKTGERRWSRYSLPVTLSGTHSTDVSSL